MLSSSRRVLREAGTCYGHLMPANETETARALDTYLENATGRA